jgi:hypothetical protein
VRVAALLTATAFAAVAASVAHAEARPLSAQDKALLARAATYEEQIGEQSRAGSPGTRSPSAAARSASPTGTCSA